MGLSCIVLSVRAELGNDQSYCADEEGRERRRGDEKNRKRGRMNVESLRRTAEYTFRGRLLLHKRPPIGPGYH